jgi:hypothetical protein
LHNAVVLVRSPTGAIRPLFQKDLTRNWLGRDGDVVYAHDPEGRFGELRSMFPTRRFFVYERGPNEQWGTLSPLP